MAKERKKEEEKGELVPVARLSPFWPIYWPSRDFTGRGISRMMEDIESMLGSFWSEDFPAWPSSLVSPWKSPAIDIKDEGDKYVMEADMPGVSKEDVSIEIRGNTLEISAEKEEEREEKEKKGYVRRERGYVSYSRRLRLPDDAVREGIEAKLEQGVLKLNIPKSAEKKEEKRKVEVK
jgi:HSP20 family protein